MAFNKKNILNDNIKAIQTIFRLESENRKATPEERAVLSSYHGFGGLKFILLPCEKEEDIEQWPQADRPYFMATNELFTMIRNESKSPEEAVGYIRSMKSSVTTAFYTPESVTDAIAASFKNAGFTIGNMLDPSAGQGRFSSSFRKFNNIKEVMNFEKDLLTGKLLYHLSNEDKVTVDGFENLPKEMKGTFDLAASNIPFGDIAVFDPEYSRNNNIVLRQAAKTIHNYFFLKGIDAVRDGGIVAFITSRGVLDSPSNEGIRREIAKRADIVAVYRLPDNLFLSEAGTAVGSDLIALQKNEGKENLTDRDMYFIESETSTDGININSFISTFEAETAICSEKKIGTDPYGKPAYVYLCDGGPEAVGNTIRERLSVALEDFASERYAAMQGKTEVREAQVKKPAEVEHKPVQLSLFDMWEDDVATVKKNEPLRLDYDGEIFDFYRNGTVVEYKDRLGTLWNLPNYPYFLEVKLNADQTERMKQYIKIRNAYETLYSYEAENREEDISSRNELNKEYDAFVSRYGNLNERRNSKLLMMDGLGRDILSLERSDEGKFVKADIFSHPVSFIKEELSHVDTPEDALWASLNKGGSVDLKYMSSISDFTEEELEKHLKGKMFYNPMLKNYEAADRFLSGNVVRKLDMLQSALENDPTDGRIEEAYEAVKAVVPAPIPFDDIGLNFGERWISPHIYEDYIRELFGSTVDIDYDTNTDTYSVSCEYKNMKIRDEFAVKGQYKRYDGIALLAHAFQNTSPLIYKCVGQDENGNDIKVPDVEKIQLANSKIDEIRNGFIEWLQERPEDWKEELARQYNNKFNCFVKANYDGSHQTFPGLDLKALSAPRFGVKDIYKSQKDCIWMLLQNGGGICDHEVGTGKTLIMCIAAHEMHRLKVANKPMIIGLKANVAAIAATYRAAYPNDRILYASEKDFSPKNRVRFFNDIKNNDYACVIMSHDQFGKIPQSLEIQEEITSDELNATIESLEVLRRQGHSISKKMLQGLEQRMTNLKAKLNNIRFAISERQDDFVDFKMMGIDHIFVDESHQFKNLMFQTRHRNVAGLGNSTGSQKALNMLYAIRTIQKRNGKDLGATFLSGTTISNSLTELYLLFKYLRPNALKEQDIHCFDAWAAVFAQKTRDYEFSVTNSVVMKERFRYFVKVPELAAFYNEITDYRTGDSVGLDRPSQNVMLHNIHPTEDQEDFNQRLMEFAKSGDGNLIYRDKLSDNEQKGKMLIATDASRKAALDMRLIGDWFEDNPDNKASHCAKMIAEYYNKYNDQKGTQFVFSDLSTYKPDGWNVFSEIKRKLTEDYGIPQEEIRFIQECKNEKQRNELIEKMNSGEVRVLFGSTSTLGTGVNAQKRAVAVHHLDIPWRPSDLEQRNGRARRTGNLIAKEFAGNNVDIIIYAVEHTLDSYKFNLLQNKQTFITQLKTNSLGSRKIDEGSMDEDGGMNFSEYVAILSGNTSLLEKAKLEKKIMALESEKKTFQQAQHETSWKLDRNKSARESDMEILEKMRKDWEGISPQVRVSEKDKAVINSLVLDQVDSKDEKAMGEYLQRIARTPLKDEAELGYIYGLPFCVRSEYSFDGIKRKFTGNNFYVSGELKYRHNNGKLAMSDKVLAARYAVKAVLNIPKLIKTYEERIEYADKNIKELERIAGKQWNKEEELSSLREELRKLSQSIELELQQQQDPRLSQKEPGYKIEREGRSFAGYIRKTAYAFVPYCDMKMKEDDYNVNLLWAAYNDESYVVWGDTYKEVEDYAKAIEALHSERARDEQYIREMAEPCGQSEASLSLAKRLLEIIEESEDDDVKNVAEELSIYGEEEETLSDEAELEETETEGVYASYGR